MTNPPVHPFADMFPLLTGEQYAALCADIREHGLEYPLTVTAEGVLVDGRNRLAACREVGVTPRWQVLPEGTTEVETLDLVMSRNLHRRHLDQTDRALLGVEYKKRFEAITGGKGARSDLRPDDHRSEEHRRPASRDKAAAVVGVSATSIERAARVIRDAPDLAEKMRNKEITLAAADDERKRREEGKKEGVKEEKRGSTRSESRKAMAMLSQISALVHMAEQIDPSAFSADDIKEFDASVTALVVFRRKLKEQIL